MLVLLGLSGLLLPLWSLPCAWIFWPGPFSIPHVVQSNNQLYHLPYITWHRRWMFHNQNLHCCENSKTNVNTQTCSLFWRTVYHVSQFIRWIIILEGEMEILCLVLAGYPEVSGFNIGYLWNKVSSGKSQFSVSIMWWGCGAIEAWTSQCIFKHDCYTVHKQ